MSQCFKTVMRFIEPHPPDRGKVEAIKGEAQEPSHLLLSL